MDLLTSKEHLAQMPHPLLRVVPTSTNPLRRVVPTKNHPAHAGGSDLARPNGLEPSSSSSTMKCIRLSATAPKKIVISSRWLVVSDQEHKLSDNRPPATVLLRLFSFQTSKRSGYDWFLHETGVTAPKTENSLFWNFREREHRSR